jgi:hypothetical protein
MFFHFFVLFDCNLRTYGINNNKEAKAECAGIFLKYNKKFDFQMVRLQLPLFIIIILAAGILIHFQMYGKSDVIRKCVRFNDAPKWMIFSFYDFKLLFFSFSFLL